MVLIICSIYLKQPLLLLLLSLYCIYFCCSRQFKLLLVVGICSFFIVPRCLIILEKTDKSYSQKQQFVLKIEEDSLKINGDSLSFSGTNSRQERFSCYYRIKNKEEKDYLIQKPIAQNFVTVYGQFSKGRKQRNLGGFDQVKYLRSHHYCGNLNVEKLQWKTKKSFNFRQIRASCIRQLKQKLPNKTRAYLSALFLGYKDQDFKETQAVLSPTGILHFFSISGLHVHIFLGTFLYFLQFLRLTLKQSLPLLILFGGIIVLFSGGGIGIWRATLSFFLGIATKLAPLSLSQLDKFSIVLLLCLFKDPLLIFQMGGQLSFIMALLLLTTDNTKSTFKSLKKSCWLTLLALPLISFYFYEWPILGGVFTIILLPIFKFFLLPVGFIIMVGSFFITDSFFASLFENFIQFFENILNITTFFTLPIGWLPPFFVLFLMLLGVFLYQRKYPRWLVVVLLVFLPFMVNRLLFPLMTVFVDVGQGDAILFKSRFNREVILVDTGGKLLFETRDWQRKIQNSNAQNTLIPVLKSLGITRIDKVFITHGDTDHMGDLEEVLHHFNVKQLILGDGSQNHKNMVKTLKKLPRKTALRVVKGKSFVNGIFPMYVFAPIHGQGENEDSLVLQIQIRKQRFLLTGDLHQAGEEQLVKDYPNLKSDVLKLGHHGSRTSSSLKFIRTVAPKTAIISCGLNNQFGHPHKEVLRGLNENQIQTLRTDQHGMIYFKWRIFQSEATPVVIQESPSSK